MALLTSLSRYTECLLRPKNVLKSPKKKLRPKKKDRHCQRLSVRMHARVGTNAVAVVFPLFRASTRGLALARISLDRTCVTRTHAGAHATRTSLVRTLLVPPLAFHVHPMCNTRSIFKIYRCNAYNIRKRQMKHLKYASKTPTKIIEKHCKHTQTSR